MSKPINSQTPAKPAAPQKVKIGGVEFNENQIEKAETYTKNGKKMNSVFLKPGVQIEYPDQANTEKSPRVESLGLRDEWYNHDDSHISIYDLEGATITGAANKDDYICLDGKSKNNTVIVDQKESWYVSKNARKDTVVLGADSSNNTVKMDDSDKLEIEYTHPTTEIGENPLGTLKVNGKGTSEQELQLKHDLGNQGYQYHKFRQKNSSIFNN